MLSDTRSAPRVSHTIRTLVGALHRTGVRGPMSDTKRGPGAGGDEVVVVEGRLGGVVVDAGDVPVVELTGAVVEDVGGGPLAWLLLLHAARSITAPIVADAVIRAYEVIRARRTLRS